MSSKHNRKPGTLVISLDFEMFWGLADFAREDEWAPIIHGVHDVVPRLLNLFQEFGVHATWATVGALMCDNKEEFINMLPYPHAAQTEKVIRRLQLSDDSQNPKLDKMLFAPELVEMIQGCDGQEIGTHTFSHYYCDDSTSEPVQFYRELEASRKLAEQKGYSFNAAVFPRNQVSEAYVAEIQKTPIKCYRGVEGGWIAKVKDKLGILGVSLWYLDNYIPLQRPCSFKAGAIEKHRPVNIRNSRFFKPYRPKYKILEGLKIKRYCHEMKFAARHGEIYHIYWHPHNFAENTEINFEQMRTLLTHYRKMHDQYGMKSLNMTETVDRISD